MQVKERIEPGSRNAVSAAHFILMIAVGAAVLIFSVMPPMSLYPGMQFNSGIVPHVIASGALCFLICLWLLVAGTTQTPVLYAFILSCLLGMLIECVQFVVPYRSFEVVDIMINCLSASIATVPCIVMTRYVPLYRKQLQSRNLVLD